MEIKNDDLSDGEVISLMEEHLSDMYATSPPECVHALDINALKGPRVTFFSAWENETLAGCIAIKSLSSEDAEIKSMRTAHSFRGKGVASKLLLHLLNFAKQQGYTSVSLETGTQSYFAPARKLYKKFGFMDCGPFSDYKLNANSQFMTRGV
ncbi:GNAT family N-acetyltransferase [Idiomarina sp.]|uniref:GNAT family N-acetyltransferase n=1 Tax=Idiomarina sp. TaxID=1874361 RepID=UPI003A935191